MFKYIHTEHIFNYNYFSDEHILQNGYFYQNIVLCVHCDVYNNTK